MTLLLVFGYLLFLLRHMTETRGVIDTTASVGLGIFCFLLEICAMNHGVIDTDSGGLGIVCFCSKFATCSMA